MSTEQRAKSKRFLTTGGGKFALLLIGLCALYIAILLFAYSPAGNLSIYLGAQAAIGILCILSALAVIIGIPLLLMPRFKRSALLEIRMASVTFIAIVIAMIAGERIRVIEFSLLTKRAEPITKAISDYESSHGKPPGSLDELVPKYMAKIPGTGMGPYPKYEYEVLHAGSDAGWELKILCPLGTNNNDLFFFRPGKRYDQSEHGGRVERIGDWAYVHE
ncbi:MAG TPA: hypothetical protein V6D17_22975 [Candidatus Obscuribacterales bacterium]